MNFFKTFMDDLRSGKQPSYFPDDLIPDENGLMCLGGRLTVHSVVEAYAKGMFPWTGADPIPWFSPDPRLVLVPKQFKASRRLRRIVRQNRFRVRMDFDYPKIMQVCAEVPRKGQAGTWITDNMIRTYCDLHKLHITHSVEVYDSNDDLCGGLYGLALGRAFFGESMFSFVSNASKIALFALCVFLNAKHFDLIDCQQVTPYLMSLGAEPVSRRAFLDRLERAVAAPSLHEHWGKYAPAVDLTAMTVRGD